MNKGDDNNQTIYIYRRKNSSKTAEKMPPLTTEKQAFYQAKGLTKEDMAFFRHTMQTTKETIQHIDTTMEKPQNSKQSKNATEQ